MHFRKSQSHTYLPIQYIYTPFLIVVTARICRFISILARFFFTCSATAGLKFLHVLVVVMAFICHMLQTKCISILPFMTQETLVLTGLFVGCLKTAGLKETFVSSCFSQSVIDKSSNFFSLQSYTNRHTICCSPYISKLSVLCAASHR